MHPLRLIGHQPLLLCATTHNSRVLNTSHRDALPPQQEHTPQGGQVFRCTPLRLIGRQHCSCVVQRVKHISLGCTATTTRAHTTRGTGFHVHPSPSNWAPATTQEHCTVHIALHKSPTHLTGMLLGCCCENLQRCS